MLRLLSLVALSATVVPALLFVTGTISLDVAKWSTLAGTVLWFVVTPLWMGRELSPDADQVQI